MAPDIRGFDDESMQKQDESIDDAIFHFDSKNVFSLKNNPMCGITFGQWLRVLHENGRFIEWKYVPRALFLTLTALFNSLLAIVESILYPDSRIAQVKLPDDPVFIVGHPRTGTTLMHNLLASDTATFYSCTTFCAGFPTCFLWFESWGKWLFAGILDKTRPMDSMALHFDLPQEDECATTILSAGASYYMPIYMMTREAQFRRFLDFCPEQGATPEDEARWTSSFLYLLRKLTLRKQLLKLGDRFLLKSPIHAARIPILRKLFPKARFIYMHRDPYETMASSAHLANTAFWFMYLSTPTDEQVTEYLFWNFRQLWLKYNAAAEVKSSSRVVHEDILEMSYVDLITKPEESLRRVYTHAKVPWTEAKRAHFAAEMQALSSYKVNQHRVMAPAMRARIQKEAQQFMDAFGYH